MAQGSTLISFDIRESDIAVFGETIAETFRNILSESGLELTNSEIRYNQYHDDIYISVYLPNSVSEETPFLFQVGCYHKRYSIIYDNVGQHRTCLGDIHHYSYEDPSAWPMVIEEFKTWLRATSQPEVSDE